jgi:DNA (cytosine-5)-methyltransferase 1
MAVITYGSVCSGIEAASAAWHGLGWKPSFFSEIEAFPRAVLTHHYSDVPLHGDFTTIKGDEYEPIDLLVGGTPCQSFSIAGLRGGLDDDRGNLALEFCRLAQRLRPRWIVWENVPGVLSSGGGRDFGSILGALEELGYGLAYRVLDAQYFGVAQRRRRVFVVGYLGDWRRAAAVLFERHSLSGHPAPRREARKETARAVVSGAEERGGCGGDGSSVDWPADVACTLDTDFASKWGQNNQHVNAGCPLFVPDSVGTLRTRRPGEGGVQGDFDHIVPVVSPALNTQSGSHHAPDTKAYVTYAIMPMNSGKDYKARETEVAQPIMAGGDSRGLDPKDTAQLQRCQVPAVVAFQSSQSGVRIGDTHATLDANNGSRRHNGIATASAVRRLTPRECERLQGFPEVQNSYSILLCRDYSGHQKHNALAALQSRKLPSNVWIADANGWTLSAEAAAHHSSTSQADPAPPVALDVLIDLERMEARLLSAERSFLFASNAAHPRASPLPTGIKSFAHLAALTTQIWAQTIQGGKAASRSAIAPSMPLLNGSSIALAYGREIEALADAASESIGQAIRFTTSTTSRSGADIPNFDLILRTLSSCVARATDGFIPERMKAANSYVVRLTTTEGFTAIPWRGKPADQCPDGPRYKALGNSMAVPVMRWIGERIEQVEMTW